MNKRQLIRINSFYEKLQTKDSFSERVAWDDTARQYLRFSEIKSFIGDLSGSILDVGCGNAEFLQFLKGTGFEGSYLGIDVNHKLLQEAKKRFPEANFKKKDIINIKNDKYDYVIASGIFNFDYGQDIKLVKNMCAKMFSLASRKAIFNGICSQVSRRDEGFFYIDQWEICRWFEKELGCMAEIRSGFVKFNFTISMSRTFS
jgi:SAM-dependent methyltransferase